MKLKNLFAPDTGTARDPFLQDASEGCCGKHKICQKNRVPNERQNPVEYFDDDELDAFSGRSSDSYTDDEAALFAAVFHTLWETDIPGWLRSLQLRGIPIPDQLHQLITPHL
jgi:hypothetical protein